MWRGPLRLVLACVWEALPACVAGSEKKAIFISTVLSTNYRERVGRDVAEASEKFLPPRAVGMFGDSKPFNVAVSLLNGLRIPSW